MSDKLLTEAELDEVERYPNEPLYDYDNYDFKNDCYYPDPELTSPEFDIEYDFFSIFGKDK